MRVVDNGLIHLLPEGRTSVGRTENVPGLVAQRDGVTRHLLLEKARAKARARARPGAIAVPAVDDVANLPGPSMWG